MPINLNCGSCQCPLSVSRRADCNRALCPECGQVITVPTKSGRFADRGNVRQLATYCISHITRLDQTRFPTFEHRCQAVSRIDAHFRYRFGHLLDRKPTAVVDKSSDQVSLIYDTIYVDARLADQIKAFLAEAFRPYE